MTRPDGTTEQAPAGVTGTTPQQPATGQQQATMAGGPPTVPGQAAPGDSGAPVPENLKTLFAPTTRPGTTVGASGAPTLPTAALLGQGNDPATGQAFYHRLVGTDGAAAARLRSLDADQLQQLAADGPPRTAAKVIDIATGTQPGAPNTRQEYNRQVALQKWLGNSTEPPADFQALASALPAAEREKLDQTFEAYTPGNLNNPGALSSWGRQASTWLRETMDRADRERTSTVIPGSLPDRINRGGAKLVADLPEGTLTALEHLLTQDQMTGSNPFSKPTPLIGETEEQAYERTHPFDQDLKAMAQYYSNDLAPIAKENDWSKLGNHFRDDPIGAMAAYAPIGPPSAKLGSRLARADQALVDAARARLGGERGPPAAASTAVAAAPNPGLAAAAPESVPSGSLAGQRGAARPPSTMAADGEKAVEAIKRGDMPAATKFLAPRPAEAPSDAATGRPSVARDGAIEALKSGDNAKLAEELVPKPLIAPQSGRTSTQPGPSEGRPASGEDPVGQMPQSGPGSVNAVGGNQNCVSCAISGDSTLAGRPASATNLHPGEPIPGGNQLIEKYAGAPWRAVSGRDAIERELLAAGNGARGIVYGSKGEYAHVWNAVVQRGKVNFVDFQDIGPSGPDAFKAWDKFYFVRTN